MPSDAPTDFSFSRGEESGTCCPIFRLSPELRNHIYEPVLVSQHPFCLTTHGDPSDCGYDRYSVTAEPPLVRTCRMIRQESLSIYYGCNTFQFRSYQALVDWLHGLGPAKRKLLYNLRGFNERAPWISPKRAQDRAARTELLLEQIGLSVRPLAFYAPCSDEPKPWPTSGLIITWVSSSGVTTTAETVWERWECDVNGKAWSGQPFSPSLEIAIP